MQQHRSIERGGDNRNPPASLRGLVHEIVAATPVIDVHTHLFPSEFETLNLYGIDELLTYHYLIAELFRSSDIEPGVYWKLSKTQQADLIWRTLFVENSPVSEAARGVVTVLSSLGLDPDVEKLDSIREWFGDVDASAHIDRIFDLAGVRSVVMTNDPLDNEETMFWRGETGREPRFSSSLRMDRLLNGWPAASDALAKLGYTVHSDLGGRSVAEVRRFLDEWIAKMRPLYLAVSFPADFRCPSGMLRDRMLDEVVMPTARDHGLPFSPMIGVRRGVNPHLRQAGDGVGNADVASLEHLCRTYPDVQFMATFLSRENQHELCVAARKFGNLTPFGCWWFLNNPSIISEITTERLELLGLSFIPQHSDARVLEQLIYKWKHSRAVIADCLADAYERLERAGRRIGRDEIERDAARLFSGNFEKLVGRITF